MLPFLNTDLSLTQLQERSGNNLAKKIRIIKIHLDTQVPCNVTRCYSKKFLWSNTKEIKRKGNSGLNFLESNGGINFLESLQIQLK